MYLKFWINKHQINHLLHARFILNEADGICGIDITAALCMDNKKVGLN